MPLFDPVISTTATYGGMQPLQTHYGAAKPYWAAAGSGGGGSSVSTINTQNILASTIILSGGGSIDVSYPALVLNGNPIVFSGSGDYDNSSMAIQQNGNAVIPYGTSTVDPNVIQIFCEGTPDLNVPGKILTGGVYFNPQQSFISSSVICSEITGDASGNVSIIGESLIAPTTIALNEIVNGAVATQSLIRTGDAYQSTLNIGLYDSGGNPLAELGFRDSGLATNTISAQSFTALNTGVGLGSVFYPGFNNSNSPLDILQAMPLARVLNSSGGDATSSTGLNTFGRMTPGTTYTTIPATTWSDAAKVVLAPRTFFNVFTGPMGSGGSAQYNNTLNDLFSTFTVQSYQTSNTFNSYVLGFGN